MYSIFPSKGGVTKPKESVPGWQVVWKEQTFIAEDCNSLKLKLLKFNNNRNITDNDFIHLECSLLGSLEASP